MISFAILNRLNRPAPVLASLALLFLSAGWLEASAQAAEPAFAPSSSLAGRLDGAVAGRLPGRSLLFAQGAKKKKKDDGFGALGIVGIVVGAVVLAGVVVLVVQSKGSRPANLTMTHDQLGAYRLLNLMMTGASSQIWEASEIASGRHFAIKMLLPEKAGDAEQRRLLFYEAEVGKELEHPNIIRVAAIIKDPKYPHFVMDFFPGGNLKGRIMHMETAHHFPGREAPEEAFLKENAHSILKQAATAYAFMNAKGWVHRDIKPENILVNASGEVRIIDLAIAYKIPTGMARKLYRAKGKPQGTRSYMSPEQIRNEILDGRSDIYSFAATAYELVTGRPPFRAANSQELLNKHLFEKPISPQTHNSEITEEFANLVLKMLSKKKEDRPGSFHEILIALRKMRVFKGEIIKKSNTT